MKPLHTNKKNLLDRRRNTEGKKKTEHEGSKEKTRTNGRIDGWREGRKEGTVERKDNRQTDRQTDRKRNQEEYMEGRDICKLTFGADLSQFDQEEHHVHYEVCQPSKNQNNHFNH